MKATCLDGHASKKGMNGIDWANKCGDIRLSREEKVESGFEGGRP